MRRESGRANWLNLNSAKPIQSVRVSNPRDLMREARTLARRANAMHAEGLTAWHARKDPDGVGGTPRSTPASPAMAPFPQKSGLPDGKSV